MEASPVFFGPGTPHGKPRRVGANLGYLSCFLVRRSSLSGKEQDLAIGILRSHLDCPEIPAIATSRPFQHRLVAKSILDRMN
jgi:hypothetical protein